MWIRIYTIDIMAELESQGQPASHILIVIDILCGIHPSKHRASNIMVMKSGFFMDELNWRERAGGTPSNDADLARNG